MVEVLDPEQNMEKRASRRASAFDSWQEVARLAEANGLRLIRQTGVHYQLCPPKKAWILNIYPGNCRLYSDKNTPRKAPFLNFAGRKWTLHEVVEEAIVKLLQESELES